MAESTTGKITGAHISKPIVTAQDVLNNTNYGGTLTIPIRKYNEGSVTYDTTTVPFYLKNSFSFSLGNEWKELARVNDAIGAINDLANGIATIVASVSNNEYGQITLQSKQMSAAVWTGSKSPTFRIDTVFISTSRSYNPLEIINVLGETCLPETMNEAVKVSPNVQEKQKQFAGSVENITRGTVLEDLGASASTFIKELGLVAPCSYGFKMDDSGISPNNNSTLTLQIGNWFRATELVVVGIDNITFSKEMIAPFNEENTYGANDRYKLEVNEYYKEKSGYPLYVECSLTLKPITMITWSDFTKYFINLGNDLQVKSGESVSETLARIQRERDNLGKDFNIKKGI